MAPQIPSHLLITLTLTIPLGIYFLFILGFAPQGVMQRLQAILSTKPYALWPGTTTPLKTVFTRIPAIDEILTNLNPFFAPILDGRDPSLSLWSLFMTGQYGAAWGLCVLEGLREGNHGRAVSFVGTTGLLMQLMGFAIAFPSYLLTHALTSPTSISPTKKNISISSRNLKIFPWSLAIGFVLPTFLLATYQGPDMSHRQNLLSIWQAFPIWTIATHKILSLLFTPKTTTTKATAATKNPQIQQLRMTYTLLLLLASTTHIPILLYSLYSLASPFSSKSTSFPQVFIPLLPLPLPAYASSSFAEAVHVFLWWDIYNSFLAAVVWCNILLQGVKPTEKGVVDWMKFAGWVLLTGPFGGIVTLVWERDELVLNGSGGEAGRDD